MAAEIPHNGTIVYGGRGACFEICVRPVVILE